MDAQVKELDCAIGQLNRPAGQPNRWTQFIESAADDDDDDDDINLRPRDLPKGIRTC